MDDIYIRQILKGNVNSYRYLVNKYKNMVFTIARDITKADLIAEEVAQDTFLKAYQNLERFKRKAKFSTWLYKIAVNESLRRMRKKRLKYENLEDLPVNDIQIGM